ncbi:pilus assembly protein TadG-related protein [Hyphococcus sp.]|uniref:pilus assembly protein TadG-related protein n=1 Tax=Hyphococcus sp. TaxID=2038636 RepID=UPI0035C6B6EB
MLVRDTGVVGEDKSAKRSPFDLRPTIKSFAGNRDGNIFFLFAFMATVLFLFAGGAVDYTRWNAVRADMVESMDAASLALAQLNATDPDLTDAQLKEYGRKFFEANFNYEHTLEPGWNIEFGLDNNAVIITCITGKIETYLLGVAGIHDLDIGKCVEITKKGSGRVELALVLDVTGSMGWNASGDDQTKMYRLKEAVETMLDVMYGEEDTTGNIKIGVVPFNAYVNAGGASSWSNSWADTNAEAYYHGARFIHVGEDGEVDVTRKVNHFDLFDSVANVSWQGCVEARPYPLDELDVSPGGSMSISDINAAMDIPSAYSGSSNPQDVRNYDAFDDAPDYSVANAVLTDANNSRWVPSFHGDEPDCDADWNGRCPYYHGDSYWTDSETFNISGSPFTQAYWRSWFTDPAYDGQSDSYYNQDFVNDEEYIGLNGGEPTGRYAKIVAEFRTLGGSGLSASQIAWRDYMQNLGVSDWYDTDITASDDSSEADSDEYILRNAYVGWWDSATETYKYKYDQSPSVTSSRGPNLNCPPAILPLTESRSTIETYVDSLTPNGNTDSAHGAAWGWRILSPEAPFEEGIGPGDPDYEKWQKAVVIMTDGENTVGYRDTHTGSSLGLYGFASEERMGDGMNTTGEMVDEIDNKLLRICHRMKEEGYLIYTIMFDLDSSSTEAVFKACATRPIGPYFQAAADGEDLEEAFGEIAADLVNLHISK